MSVDALARVMISSAPSAVVALDTEGRITMLNSQAEALLATSVEDAVGSLYQAIFGESLSQRMLALFLRSARAGDSTTPHLVRATLPSGRQAELRASTGPVRDQSGAIVGVLFVADETNGSGSNQTIGQSEVTARLRQALRRYLGESIATMVENRPSFIGVGGVRQEVSVLHADIRGYTTLAEDLGPEAVATLLLRYHGPVVEALQRNGATLDRFIGDAVLAMWNAPVPCDEHSRAAILGALTAQAAARAVGQDVAYGIAVHTGEALVGNVGTESFLNYTAVGDTVNVAARLQAEAGPGEVLCTEPALAAAGEGIRTVSLGALRVKGRKDPIQAYRVVGLDHVWSAR
jgi:PAS domain S-box-containing protein